MNGHLFPTEKKFHTMHTSGNAYKNKNDLIRQIREPMRAPRRNSEEVPTLHVDLGNDNSMELCALRLNKGVFPQQVNNISFFSQWESDEDDIDEKRLLECLERRHTLKQKGTMHEEFFHNNRHSDSNQQEYDAPDGQEETKTNKKEPSSDNNKSNGAPHSNNGESTNNNNRDKTQQRSVPQLTEFSAEDIEDLNRFRALSLSPLERKNGDMGDTVITEYVENTKLNCSPPSDSDKLSKNKESLPSNNNSSIIESMEKVDEIKDISPVKLTRPKSKSKSNVLNEEEIKQSDLVSYQKKKERETYKPVYFNIIVVGESGMGKSTFIDAFFKKKFKLKERIRPSTLDIQEITGERFYKDMSFKMKLIDTPGYGPRKDIREWYKMIKGHIKKQFVSYRNKKKKELKDRKASLVKPLEDNRVHACLYFISGPRISHLDLIYMKKLQKYVNIIPVLGKGDAYTVQEIRQLKVDLIKEAHDSKIEWFDFSLALRDHPNKIKELNEGKFGPSPPFLMISSIEKISIGEDNYVFGREYSWGVCNIENPAHSDFILLSDLLGGYICFECVAITEIFYKEFFKRLKRKRKDLQLEQTRTKNLGIGAAFAFSIVGAYMIIKQKANMFK